jgi:hypothetical protein
MVDTSNDVDNGRLEARHRWLQVQKVEEARLRKMRKVREQSFVRTAEH